MVWRRMMIKRAARVAMMMNFGLFIVLK